jgi:hypothetical protein
VVRRIESSLAAGGFTLTRDSVAGRRTVIGRRSAIRRHTFVLVAVFKADATPDHLDRFAAEADQYARTVRGGPVRGRSAVAVAVVESGPAVPGWRPGAAGPGRACLVLVDVTGGRVTGPVDVAPDGPADPHLAQLVRDHVATAVWRPAPP